MSVKLSVSGEPKAPPVAETDLIDSANAACEAYEALLIAGADVAEMTEVIGNINFIKDIIQTNGVKWFKENCDPKDDFGRLYGLTGTDKETWIVGCDIALEGMITSAWDKIKAFFRRLVDWFKGIFEEKAETVAEKMVEEAKKETQEVANEQVAAKPEEKIEVKNVVVPPKKTSFLRKTWNLISKLGSKTDGATKTEESSDGIVKLSAMPTYIKIIQAKLDIWSTAVPLAKTRLEKYKAAKNLQAFQKCMDEASNEVKDTNTKLSALETDLKALESKVVSMNDKGEFSLSDMEIVSITDIQKFCKYCDDVKAIVHGSKFKGLKKELLNLMRSTESFSFSGDAELGGEIVKMMTAAASKYSAIADDFNQMQLQYDAYLAPFAKSISGSVKKASKSKKKPSA